MGEFIIFALAGIVGLYCYNHSKMYRSLVDGKSANEEEDNKE